MQQLNAYLRLEGHLAVRASVTPLTPKAKQMPHRCTQNLVFAIDSDTTAFPQTCSLLSAHPPSTVVGQDAFFIHKLKGSLAAESFVVVLAGVEAYSTDSSCVDTV